MFRDKIHFDPHQNRRALPLRLREDINEQIQQLVAENQTITVEVRSTGKPMQISLVTDSPHLARFFRSQWPAPEDGRIGKRDGLMICMSHDPKYYGFDESFSGARLVSSDRKTIAWFGTEYYGNVKISTRGLCSSGAQEGTFVHGAALAIENRGVIISGVSGAGKTTTTGAIRDNMGFMDVVNDDWGPCSAALKEIYFAGEVRLHMKCRSVDTLKKNFDPNQYQFLENFDGDSQDPNARLLIEPAEVLGKSCLEKANWNLYVALFRRCDQPFYCRELVQADINLIEDGQFSPFYDRNERFMDGSLLHLSEKHISESRNQFLNILQNIPAIAINNSGTPGEAANAILSNL